MPKIVEGTLKGEGLKFCLIVSRRNDFITNRLLEGALDALTRCGVRGDDIEITKVPGSFEIPAIARKMTLLKRFDAIICLGAVIRGATPHFEYISTEVTKGIAAVGIEAGIPVIYGVLTTDTIEQAIERAGTKGGNRGWDAAINAIEMVNLYKNLK